MEEVNILEKVRLGRRHASGWSQMVRAASPCLSMVLEEERGSKSTWRLPKMKSQVRLSFNLRGRPSTSRVGGQLINGKNAFLKESDFCVFKIKLIFMRKTKTWLNFFPITSWFVVAFIWNYVGLEDIILFLESPMISP
jgi:hypothetical protein